MVVRELSIEIYGRVQGVGFRSSLKRIAKKLGVKGFVRNKEDGGVEVLAQGERAELEKLLEWVNTNPGLTDIIGLSYHWSDVVDEIDEFKVKSEGNVVVDKIKGVLNLSKKVFGVKSKRPLHVAIIPDGNRRWAKQRGLDASFGHYKASIIDNVIELIDESKKLGVKYLSFWAFSTENWKRDEREIEALFSVLIRAIPQLRKIAYKDKIRFRHVGRKDRLPESLVGALTELEDETSSYDTLSFQLCLDYGGVDEIVRGVNKLIGEGVKLVDENGLRNSLDSSSMPDVDLIIRTSGEKRLSGFMPLQSAYAELYFCDKMFPDFKARDLRDAVEEFGRRKRRFGGT